MQIRAIKMNIRRLSKKIDATAESKQLAKFYSGLPAQSLRVLVGDKTGFVDMLPHRVDKAGLSWINSLDVMLKSLAADGWAIAVNKDMQDGRQHFYYKGDSVIYGRRAMRPIIIDGKLYLFNIEFALNKRTKAPSHIVTYVDEPMEYEEKYLDDISLKSIDSMVALSSNKNILIKNIESNFASYSEKAGVSHSVYKTYNESISTVTVLKKLIPTIFDGAELTDITDIRVIGYDTIMVSDDTGSKAVFIIRLRFNDTNTTYSAELPFIDYIKAAHPSKIKW